MEGQLAINAALAGAHYGLVALSFAVVSRTARFFHVAHGAVYTFAAYVTLSLATVGLDLPLAAVGGVLSAAVLGCALDVSVFRTLRRFNTSPESQLLASFGLLIVLQNVIALTWGDARLVLSTRSAGPGIAVLGGHITLEQIVSIGITVAVVIGFVVWSRRSLAGLVLRAVGDDPELARARGIRADLAILAAFAIASGLMGLAGILQAVDAGMTPLMGFRALLVAFAGALLGGLHSDTRAFFGGVAIGVLEQIGARYLPGQWYESAILALLIATLVVRRQVLVGERRR